MMTGAFLAGFEELEKIRGTRIYSFGFRGDVWFALLTFLGVLG